MNQGQQTSICSLCHGQVQIPAIPNVCQHIFCYKCLLEWSRSYNVCPQCRVRYSQLIRLNPLPPGLWKSSSLGKIEDENEQNTQVPELPRPIRREKLIQQKKNRKIQNASSGSQKAEPPRKIRIFRSTKSTRCSSRLPK